jgi:hypothetical protein
MFVTSPLLPFRSHSAKLTRRRKAVPEIAFSYELDVPDPPFSSSGSVGCHIYCPCWDFSPQKLSLETSAHAMRNEIYLSNEMAPILCPPHWDCCSEKSLDRITSKRAIKTRRPLELARKYYLLATISLRIPWALPLGKRRMRARSRKAPS